jgi:hypothetical protein
MAASPVTFNLTSILVPLVVRVFLLLLVIIIIVIIIIILPLFASPLVPFLPLQSFASYFAFVSVFFQTN